MSAREELFEALTGGGWSLAPGEAESMNRMIDAFRVEVLREAAPPLDAVCEQYGVLGVGARLRRMADEKEGGEQ